MGLIINRYPIQVVETNRFGQVVSVRTVTDPADWSLVTAECSRRAAAAVVLHQEEAAAVNNPAVNTKPVPTSSVATVGVPAVGGVSQAQPQHIIYPGKKGRRR